MERIGHRARFQETPAGLSAGIEDSEAGSRNVVRHMPKMLRLFVVATLIAICSCADTQVESGAEEERVKLVPVQSIEAGKVQIVGRLGVPIGTVVTVSGKWHAPGGVPTKLESGIDFRITSINGKRLSDPVVFDKSEITEVLRRRSFAYSEDPSGGSVAVIRRGLSSTGRTNTSVLWVFQQGWVILLLRDMRHRQQESTVS